MDVIYHRVERIAAMLRAGGGLGQESLKLDGTFLDLFLAQSEAVPDNIAVACGETQLPYKDLLQRSRRCSSALHALGVKHGEPVVVCLERTEDLLVSLLGVMLAGACYVPVDPDFPPERIAIIAEDCGARVALVEEATRECLKASTLRFLSSEDMASASASASASVTAAQKPLPVSSADLAYILFTSGSTGRPKGVPITHGALRNFLLAMARRPGLTELDRVLALTTIAFDISVLELFLPLICGASTWIAGKAFLQDPDLLSGLIDSVSPTVIQATPSGWRLLTSTGWRARPYQKLLVGGEAFPIELARVLLSSAGEVWNMYGPTEATVWVSCHRVTDDDLSSTGIPLGEPIENVSFELIDEQGEFVRARGVGELIIAGACLTPGYWRRPDLNRDRFVEIREDGVDVDSDSTDTLIRFYRTGDRVKRLEDGRLLYAGRLDNQVKVRGYRVELEEIEAELGRIPGIAEAAVVVIDQDHLVGCLRKDVQLETADIENRLRERLPQYMVPRAWRRLDSFPHTPNRKIDRRALVVQLAEQSADEPEITPKNETFADHQERQLAKIWAELLGRAPTSLSDDFFALGGHSLLAAELSVLISQRMDRELTLVDVMHCPCLGDQAALLRQRPPLSESIEDDAHQHKARAASYPLSATQRRFWVTSQMIGESRIYHESEAYRLNGAVDVDSLRQSLRQVVSEYDAFRLCLDLREGHPVWKPIEAELLDFDVEAMGATDNVEERLRQQALLPFDLERGPLIRFRLYQGQDGNTVSPQILQITAHHLIIDGLSQTLLWRRIVDCYAAYRRGQRPEPVSDTGFTDYLSQTTRSVGDNDAFWIDYLAGPIETLDLETDYPRPARLNYRSHQQVLALPKSVCDALQRVAQSYRLTPFHILAGCFALLLSRFSGQEELVLGLAVSGRGEPRWHDVVGLFINTLPLRFQYSAKESLKALLSRFAAEFLKVIEHGTTSFDRIVELSQPDRDPSRTPLFQALFTHNDYSRRPQYLAPDCTMEAVAFDTGYSHAELVLFADQYADGLTLRLQASEQLYTHWQSARLLKCLGTLLQQALANVEQVAAAIDLMDEADHVQLRQWNDNARRYPRDSGIAAEFLKQAARRLDAIAVVHGEQQFSYRELGVLSANIRNLLMEAGVERGDRVAIAAAPSVECLAGILGILRAGAVYVPLDSRYPPDRIRLMLEDGKARIVLVDSVNSVPDGLGYRKIDIGSRSERISEDRLVGGECPAYVMFTSGSTGKPKGIAVSQRNVLRLVKNTNFMEMSEDTRFLMNAPIAFDASTLEIWAPLLNGGTLVIPGGDYLDGNVLAKTLLEHQVNAAWLTAGLFHHMAEHYPMAFAGLRYLLAGGDVLSPKWVRSVLEHHPLLTFINGYGPTENTTFTCCYKVQRHSDWQQRVPIGTPVANTRVYIVDENGNLCPPGMPGELWTGGDGVAIGYINQSATQAGAFAKDIFSEGPDDRLYKTGDRARWLEDGVVDFLGRIDQQLKIRGFRVEPDEIQTMLEMDPCVDQAVVTSVARGNSMHLVAYVTGYDIDTVALKISLSETLPSYMVPTAIVALDTIPTTANGKVDRAALPPLSSIVGSEGGTAEPPATDTEKRVAKVWGDALGIDGITRETNFFEVGGTSLTALDIFVRLEKALSVDLPLSSLYQAPTVRALSRYIDDVRAKRNQVAAEARSPDRWATLVPMREHGRRTPVLLVHAVGGNVLNYRPLLDFVEPDRPVWGIQSPALDGSSNIASSIEAMAREYVNAVMDQLTPTSVILAGGSMGGAIALQMAQEFRLQNVAVKLVVMFDTFAPSLVSRAMNEEYRFQGLTHLGKAAWRSLSARTRFYSKSLAVHFYRKTGQTIPQDLRPFNIEYFNKRLYQNFCPKPYPGPVLLIRKPVEAEGVYSDAFLGWGDLLGDLRSDFVNGDHEQMIEQPRLGQLFAEAIAKL